MSGEAIPRVTIIREPAYAAWLFSIAWDRDGRPVALQIDGVYYAVRPSPRLRFRADVWW